MAKWKEIKKKPWFQALAGVAPMVATAIGGPFGGIAATALKSALGLPPTATDEQLAAKVETATAGDILKMKNAEIEFKKFMEQANIDEQALYLEDKQSAREMQVAVKSRMPATLAILGWVQWLVVLVVVLFGDTLGVEFTVEERGYLLYVLSTAQAMALMGFSFYLGSSRGSKEKTEAFSRFMLEGGKPIG
jgi:hypothetical protein